VVYQQSYQSLYAYTLLVEGRTRSGGLYIYLGKVNIIPIKVVPISVDRVGTDVIKIRGGGASLPQLQWQALSFWDGLHQGGRARMWDFVSNKTSEPTWLPLALENSTVVFTTDGLMSGKRARM
jgi:hypothetical protein